MTARDPRVNTPQPPIVIQQDREADDDGEDLGPLNVFWAEGHGYDPKEFIRAVIDFCLDEDVDIPRIDNELAPSEEWQQNVAREGVVFYERSTEGPKSSRSSLFPITILDVEHRRRSGTRCSVNGCTKAWSSGAPIRVVVDEGDGGATINDPHMYVDLWLCRGHGKKLPEPSYRVTFVPVGATIMLPAKDAS